MEGCFRGFLFVWGMKHQRACFQVDGSLPEKRDLRCKTSHCGPQKSGWSQDPEPLRVDLLPPPKPEDKTQTQGLSSRPGSRVTPGSRKWGLEWQDWPALASEGLLIVVSDK